MRSAPPCGDDDDDGNDLDEDNCEDGGFLMLVSGARAALLVVGSPWMVVDFYYTILYYTILHYTTLYYTIPYHTIPYYTMLCSTVLFFIQFVVIDSAPPFASYSRAPKRPAQEPGTQDPSVPNARVNLTHTHTYIYIYTHTYTY